MPGWFSAVQKGLNYVGGSAGFGAAAAASQGGMLGGAARYGLQGVGMAAGAMARSPTAFMTGAGAIAGGMYGATDRDTSVLGGMLGGAAMGRYGLGAVRGARQGFRYGVPGADATGAMGRMYAAGRGALRGVGRNIRADYRGASRFIGASLEGNTAKIPVKSTLKSSRSASEIRGTPMNGSFIGPRQSGRGIRGATPTNVGRQVRREGGATETYNADLMAAAVESRKAGGMVGYKPSPYVNAAAERRARQGINYYGT